MRTENGIFVVVIQLYEHRHNNLYYNFISTVILPSGTNTSMKNFMYAIQKGSLKRILKYESVKLYNMLYYGFIQQ